MEKVSGKDYAYALPGLLESFATLSVDAEIQEGLRKISIDAHVAGLFLTPRFKANGRYDEEDNRRAEQRLRDRELEAVSEYIAYKGGIRLLASMERAEQSLLFDIGWYSEGERRRIASRVIEIELGAEPDEQRRVELGTLKERVEAVATPSSPERVK